MALPPAADATAPPPAGAITRHSRRPSSASTGIILPRDEAAPADGRRFTQGQADAWLLPEDAVIAAVLVVSELVTNAVRHGQRGQVRLRLDLKAETLTVTVADETPYQPLPAATLPADDDETGRGLALVAALSRRWGHRPVAHHPVHGTAVWAQITWTPTCLPPTGNQLRMEG